MKVTVIPIQLEHVKNPERIDKGARRPDDKRTSRDHLDYSIIKFDQNIEKISGDLRRLSLNQTPGKDH